MRALSMLMPLLVFGAVGYAVWLAIHEGGQG